MTDEVWSRAEIESPCKKICLMHPQADLCMGCFRTRHEIAGWSRMGRDARAGIMEALPARAPLLKDKAHRPSRRRAARARAQGAESQAATPPESSGRK